MRHVLRDQHGELVSELIEGETGTFVRVVGFDPDPLAPSHKWSLLSYWEHQAKEKGWTLTMEHETSPGSTELPR